MPLRPSYAFFNEKKMHKTIEGEALEISSGKSEISREKLCPKVGTIKDRNGRGLVDA